MTDPPLWSWYKNPDNTQRPAKFDQVFEGEFTITRNKLSEAASEYIRLTDEFDNDVCTGPKRNGSRMPATREEIAMTTSFAKRTLHRLISEYNLSRQALLSEISKQERR